MAYFYDARVKMQKEMSRGYGKPILITGFEYNWTVEYAQEVLRQLSTGCKILVPVDSYLKGTKTFKMIVKQPNCYVRYFEELDRNGIKVIHCHYTHEDRKILIRTIQEALKSISY